MSYTRGSRGAATRLCSTVLSDQSVDPLSNEPLRSSRRV
jgi:hypothetical protein